MADQDLSHIAELIKAGIPYVDSNLKGIAELAAKLLDLMGSLGSVGKTSFLTANGLKGIKIDVEGLLNGIRPICNIKEGEIVDQILNILNMRRMFEMYNNMMSTMQTMQEAGGFNFGDFGTSDDAENVTGNFSGPDFESIFKSFSDFNSSGNSNSSRTTEPEYSSDSVDETPPDIKEEKSTDDIPEPSASPPNNGGFMNNKMFDMLKSMVPPEQMSTFENLSMLFNNMSYDNNKNDDNKERNDG